MNGGKDSLSMRLDDFSGKSNGWDDGGTTSQERENDLRLDIVM